MQDEIQKDHIQKDQIQKDHMQKDHMQNDQMQNSQPPSTKCSRHDQKEITALKTRKKVSFIAMYNDCVVFTLFN